MKQFIIKNSFSLVLLSLVLFISSCDKVKTVTPTTTEGKAYVKILNGGDDNPAPIVKNPVDFVPTPTKLLVVDLRREVPTPESLNTTVNVTIKDDTAAVRAANPSYVNLPIAWYTIQADGVKTGGQGGTYSFTFKPGEFAKQIYITIPNATLLNPSSLYALGFSIVSADGGVTVREKALVVEIGAKNPWDGIYAVRGPLSDAVVPALVQQANQNGYTDQWWLDHPASWELHLITTGATQCVMFDPTFYGDSYHPLFQAPSTNTGYGAFALVLNFNAANGAISDIYNLWGDVAHGGSGPPNYSSSNTRRAVLDPSGANAAQGNKDILIKYFMIQTNQATGTGPRTTFNEKWEYAGPR